ncbi:hypothetical protein T07_1502 [Trichinella nelsoni]|uniref:Uncharacterized protein n=1 Tax=Trichinella nelsoni TaxID=6336 RepID=A0A0V0SFN9_9BILA|nr:hypothetical protein T07_1502 [Trichinella nelsoni]
MKIVLERDRQLLDIYFNGNGAVGNSLGLTLQLVKSVQNQYWYLIVIKSVVVFLAIAAFSGATSRDEV